MVAHDFNHSIWEVEAGSQHSEFQDILGYRENLSQQTEVKKFNVYINIILVS